MQEDGNDLNKLLTRDLHHHFFLLVLAYSEKLYSCAFYIVRSQVAAEDIVQETWERAYEALKRSSNEEILLIRLDSWLITIAYRLSLNYKRDEKYQYFSISLDLPEGRTLAEGMNTYQYPSPEKEIEVEEAYEELQACIKQLPDQFRTIVALHCIGEISYPEIAESLDKPLNTVKNNGRRGLLKLREMLTQKSSVNEEWR